MSVIIRGMRKFGGVRMRQIFTKPAYDQYLYAIEYYSSNPENIYRIDLSDGSETLIGADAVTQYHREFTVSGDNVIYPAGYSLITAYDGLTGNVLDSTSSGIYRTTTINKDGILYAMNASSNKLDVFNVNDLTTIIASQSDINAAGTNSNKTYTSTDTSVDGDVFIGGVSDDNYIHRYDSNANLVWNYQTASTGTHNVGATPDNGVVFARSNSNVLTKLDENGSFVWDSPTFGANISYLTVDYDGNTYVVNAAVGMLGKVDPSGNKLWELTSVTSSDSPRDVECDLEGNVYISTTGSKVYKFDSDGNQLWVNTTLATATDSDTYIIEVTGMSGSEKWG